MATFPKSNRTHPRYTSVSCVPNISLQVDQEAVHLLQMLIGAHRNRITDLTTSLDAMRATIRTMGVPGKAFNYLTMFKPIATLLDLHHKPNAPLLDLRHKPNTPLTENHKLQTTPDTSTKLSDVQKRDKVAEELLSTEREHVKQLELCITGFVTHLTQWKVTLPF